MRKLGFLAIAVAALMVVGSSVAFADDIATGGSEIVSPYWQADANSIYTFIGISNPSITGNLSRAVTVKAINSDGSTGAAVVFTVAVGSSTKVFIANTNHSSVNSNTVSGANWVSTTGSGHAVVAIEYLAAPNAQGLTAASTLLPATLNAAGVLSVWGAIAVPGGSGFAMEFIGDLKDSIYSTTHFGTVIGGGTALVGGRPGL